MTIVAQATPRRTRRRGHSEGSIHQRASDGRWVAVVDLGVVGAKRQRKYLYGSTRGDVAQQLTKVLRERDLGRPPDIDPARTTVAAWLETWLEHVKRTRRPNTHTLYEETVRVHIAPIIGRKRLAALRRQDVDDWIRNRELTGLAPRTIHRLWAVLHSALGHAVRGERIAQNPASRPSLPRIEKQEPRTMPREQLRKLLDALASEPDAALYVLELTTGLREGEILGLRWAHDETAPGVDLDRAEVRVAEQMQHGELVPLKRGASRRVLRLRPWVVDILQRHHTEQLRQHLRAAQRWQENGLVFPSQVGTPRKASNLWLSWKRLLKRLGLPDYKFHELRHTAASLALSEGASLFHVSRMLGHSSIAITADTYGHWTDEGREDVAARLERALLGPLAVNLAVNDPSGGVSERPH